MIDSRGTPPTGRRIVNIPLKTPAFHQPHHKLQNKITSQTHRAPTVSTVVAASLAPSGGLSPPALFSLLVPPDWTEVVISQFSSVKQQQNLPAGPQQVQNDWLNQLTFCLRTQSFMIGQHWGMGMYLMSTHRVLRVTYAVP